MDAIDVRSLLLEAERLATNIASPVDKVETLATISLNAAIAGEWEIAQRVSLVVERLQACHRISRRARASSTARLAQAYFLAGDEEIARAMLAKAIGYAGCVRDVFRLDDCVKAAIAIGAFDQALGIILRLGEPLRGIRLERLGVAMVKSGDILGAKRVVVLLKDVDSQSAILRDVALRLIRLGADHDAVEIVELIRADTWQAVAYSQLATAMRHRPNLQSHA